jgi:hypothetical protein
MLSFNSSLISLNLLLEIPSTGVSFLLEAEIYRCRTIHLRKITGPDQLGLNLVLIRFVNPLRTTDLDLRV